MNDCSAINAHSDGTRLHLVAQLAYMTGSLSQRTRVNEYISWLLRQKGDTTDSKPICTKERDDVTPLEIPSSYMGFVTGKGGETLREIEKLSGTFCFADRFAVATEGCVLRCHDPDSFCVPVHLWTFHACHPITMG